MNNETEGSLSGRELRLPVCRDVSGIVRAQRPCLATQAGVCALWIAQMEFFAGCEVSPHGLIRDAIEHGEHGVVFAENAVNRSGGVDAQRLEFAQQKQSEYLIEMRVGQHQACDSRATHANARMQLSRCFDCG